MIREEDSVTETKQGNQEPAITAQHMFTALDEAMKSIQLPPAMQQLGLPPETMESMVKLFVKHVLHVQATKMPSTHVPAEA